MNYIDLDKLFTIDRISLFLEFGDERYKPAIDNHIIKERLLNTCSFAGKIGVEDNISMQCGLVRASISELVSLEELPEIKHYNNNKPFRLHTTKHPLLCVIKELRNLQMHLSSVEMDEYEKNLLLGSIDKPEEATPTTKKIIYIDNLDINDFVDLRNYKHYIPSEFNKALGWFNEVQREWGISELLTQAAYLYAESLSNLMKK